MIWSKTSATNGVAGETIQEQKANLENTSKDSITKARSMISTQMQRAANNCIAHEMYGVDLLQKQEAKL